MAAETPTASPPGFPRCAPCALLARTLDDLDALVEGNLRIAKDTEGKVLDKATLRTGLTALLQDPQKGFYLVAEREGRVLGHLLITFEWSDWRNGVFFWIQSVWVAPEARRSGVYRALHQRVLEIAEERGDVVGLRLYVEKNNHVAQRTYQAMGLSLCSYDMYEATLSARRPGDGRDPCR